MKVIINEGSLNDIKIPEIVYKYRDWDNKWNKKFITEREVYMASPEKFEDEFDCKIPVSYEKMSEAQAENFYDDLISRSRPDLQRSQRRCEVRGLVKAKQYKDLVKMEEYKKTYFDQYFKRIGVLSLTAEPCLDDMWKRYANNHSGFCVGYNSKILFKYLGGGGSVEYFDKLPTIFPRPIMTLEEIQIKQVYSKERKWEFEKEYRTHMFWPNGVTDNNRNIKIPNEAFHSVILGKNMTDLNKTEIITAIRKSIGNIDIIDQ